MAPQDETLHAAQDWMLDQAEKEGCGDRGHTFLCRAVRTHASEMRQGFADTQQQIAMIPSLVAQHVKDMRTESRIAPLWAMIRDLPPRWRVALLLGLLAVFPSVAANTVAQIVRAILEQPVTMDAARVAAGAITGATP